MTINFQMLKEADSIVSAFEESHIRYALAGGFAVAMYGFVRATKDMDYLCHPDDVELAGKQLLSLNYRAYAEPWTFRECGISLHRFMKPSDGELFYVVDLLVPPPNRLHWIDAADRVAWGNEGHISVVTREHLVEMKRLRNSSADRADISHLEGEGP